MRRQIGSLVLSAAMAFYMVPAAAFASQSDGGDGSTAAAAIEGTAGVDYEDGDVLVAVRGGQEALEAATKDKGLLGLMGLGGSKAGGQEFTVEEDLCAVGASDLAQAAGEGDTSSASTSKTLMSVNSNEDLEILLLHGENTAELISSLSQLDCVVSAQPNYLYELTDVDDEALEEAAQQAVTTTASPVTTATATTSTSTTTTTTSNPKDEPMYDYQWSLKSTSGTGVNQQRSYKKTTGMDVAGAWDQGAGQDSEVVVAVVDSGVDYTHEDLRDNMWTGGDAEWSKALGGGTYGFDGTQDNQREDKTYDHSDPMDILIGHGTHCASTIASAWNGKGIAGVNGNAKIMACRFLGNKGTSAAALLCYNYIITAKRNGVNVVAVNNSWGLGSDTGVNDQMFGAMLYEAGEEGVITLFAAGNSGYDNDLTTGFSRNASNPYVVSVGAATSASEAANFSQSGKRTVTVYSPGVRVLAATTNYGATQEKFTSVTMDPQYIPWVSGTTSANSTYFMEGYESTQLADDGITYDLVKTSETGNVESIVKTDAAETCYAEGSDEGYLSDGYLKIPLADTGIKPGECFGVRVTISAEKWREFASMNKGDDLFVTALGYINGSATNVSMSIACRTAQGYAGNDYGFIANRDFPNWYTTSRMLSFSSFTKGQDSNGDVHFVIYSKGKVKGSGDEFTSNDYICLDNLAMGWAAYSRDAEGNVTDSYYYSDGTSMATPNTTGVVSLLSACAEAQAGTQQDAAMARKVVAYLKGGVTQLDSLKDKCQTEGIVNANTSYSALKSGDTSALHPVADDIVDNGDGTATVKGSFFGKTSGTVVFDGKELEVKSWSEDAVTFAIPSGKERAGRVELTAAGGNVGYAYLTMPAYASSSEAFGDLALPDFEITTPNLSDTSTTITANARDFVPTHMVAACGYIYAYCVSSDAGLCALLRYDVEKGAWDAKNYLGEDAAKLYAGYRSEICSMAAGETEVYMLVYDAEGKNKELLTFDAATGELKYSAEMSGNVASVATGTLAVINSRLAIVGGVTGSRLISYVYPDTGKIYGVSSTTLKSNIIDPIVTRYSSGLCLAGSYSSAARDISSYTAGCRNNMYTYSSETLKASSTIFFETADTSSAYLASGQHMANFTAAGVDDGVIATGPLSKWLDTEVADTWIYNASKDTWTACGARCYPVAFAHAASCVYEGTYYVFGTADVSENSTMVFRSASLSDLGQSDEAISKEPADAKCAPTLEDATVTIAPQVYTGEELVPEPVVTIKEASGEEATLEEGTDYKVTCEKCVEPGTYEVTITGAGYCTGSITGKFVVEKAESSVTLEDVAAAYTGEPVLAGEASVEGSAGAVAYKYYADAACKQEIASCVEAGTYYAVATVAEDAHYKSASSKPAKITVGAAKQVLTVQKNSVGVSIKAPKKSKTVVKSLTKTYGVACSTKVTYELLADGKAEGYVKVSAAGKVTVKKGLKKGSYTVKLLASASASPNYANAPQRTLYLRLLVK